MLSFPPAIARIIYIVHVVYYSAAAGYLVYYCHKFVRTKELGTTKFAAIVCVTVSAICMYHIVCMCVVYVARVCMCIVYVLPVRIYPNTPYPPYHITLLTLHSTQYNTTQYNNTTNNIHNKTQTQTIQYNTI